MSLRNFCIIAHIDHGKSTLADRFLELTQTVTSRDMQAQLLDQMDLERERGITIKLQPVRMEYQANDGRDYVLNLIDTPGHIDFTYEVSRSLAAVEGAILLVDATQGVQAQTLANLYLAMEQDLEIIPVINKIDMPSADVEKVSQEMINLIGCKPEEILKCSAKTGEGVLDILDEIVKRVPEPKLYSDEPFQAMIFDSKYDEFKGVISYVRVIKGKLKAGETVQYMNSKVKSEVLDVGYFTPKLHPAKTLNTGEIGYVISGVKDLSGCRVGDTIGGKGNEEILPGYKEVKPFVYAGLFCKQGDDYPKLRDALDKLKLNDAALIYEAEHSTALGFGFRCGFLGMLHLEIIQERIKREFDIDLIVTIPSVAYQVYVKGKENKVAKEPIVITSPHDLPEPQKVEAIEEPFMRVNIVSYKEYIGSVMNLVQEKRGIYLNTEYIDDNRAVLHYEMPLFSLIVDFYDKLKSASSGYASLSYEFLEFRKADVIKLDILVAEDTIEALSTIVYRDDAYKNGRKIVDNLKEILPRQMFEVKLQAAIQGKIIASARIPAMRKDVTAKLYGGDVTRKRKLLEKQKKGKAKMKLMGMGKVDIPSEAYIAILKR